MGSEKSYRKTQQLYPKQVYAKKVLIECHRLEEKVKIKNGTKKIASTAFNSSRVKEVTLPDSIEEIEPHAFFNCQDLQKIVFGKNIRIIENDSFVKCPNIHEIIFPENADMIHEISRPYVCQYNQKRYDPMKYSFIKNRAENPIRRSDNISCQAVGWGRMRVRLYRIVSAFFYFRFRFVYFLFGLSGFSIPCSLIYSSNVSMLAPPVVDRK